MVMNNEEEEIIISCVKDLQTGETHLYKFPERMFEQAISTIYNDASGTHSTLTYKQASALVHSIIRRVMFG